MTSNAQKRANEKYQRQKVRQQLVKFYPADDDVYSHLSIQSNKMGYIKELIRRDLREAQDNSSHSIIWESGDAQRFDTYAQWRDAIDLLREDGYPVEVWGNICTVNAHQDPPLQQ